MVWQAVTVVMVVRQAVAVRCAAVAVVTARMTAQRCPRPKWFTWLRCPGPGQTGYVVQVLQPRMPANTAVLKAFYLDTYVATLHLRISVYGVPRY